MSVLSKSPERVHRLDRFPDILPLGLGGWLIALSSNCNSCNNELRLNFESKIVPYSQLSSWREEFRKSGRALVVTNGCFDLLHLGHVTYLQAARNLGDALLVGVNSDTAVQSLKGEGRPLNSESDRAAVVAALASVDAVCVFPDVRATEFLALARPDIYVKGGDYTLATLDQDERRTVQACGGRIVLIPLVAGRSTTFILERVKGMC